MKKFIAIVLAVAMFAMLGLTAFAAEITNAEPDAQEVIVKTTLEDIEDPAWYTVTVPAGATIPWGNTDVWDMTYTVNSQLHGTDALSIAIASANASKMVSAYGEIAYTYTGTLAKTFPAVNADVDEAGSVAVAAAAWDGIAIAEYADTLTYTVEVVPAA